MNCYDSTMIYRPDNLLAIVGCTAGGKSDLAERLAAELAHRDGVPPTIMAVDSMQVYRLMDIGTAKPDAETRRRLPHAMIDVADPSEAFSAARFAEQAGPIIAEHCTAGRRLIMVVGTVLYFRAITEGLFQGPAADANVRRELEHQAATNGTATLHQRLAAVDPLAAAKIHPNDLRRLVRALEVYMLTGCTISSLQTQWQQSQPRVPCTIIGIDRPREELNRRINQRVRNMMAAGLLDEVTALYHRDQPMSKQAADGVGYRQLIAHLQGTVSLDDAVEQIKIQTRHLAKLQRTWLRRFSQVHWLKATEADSPDTLAHEALELLQTAQTGRQEPPA